MAAHGTDPGAGFADIAAQQQEINDHLHGLDAFAVLRQAHPIDAEDLLRLGVDGRRRLQGAARQSRSLLQLGPIVAAHRGSEAIEAVRMLLDEGVVEHRPATLPLGNVVGFDQRLAQAEQCRDIAAGLNLVVLRTDRRRSTGQHLGRALRVQEFDQPAFLQRVEGDDRNATLPCILQIVQHARAAGADVLSEKENAIGLGKVVEGHRADRHADALGQRHGGALVAHIGAIREIVGAVEPGQQRVHVGGFERGAARGVKHDRFRIERLQLLANVAKSILPLDRPVCVAHRIPAHRARQAAQFLEIVIGPGFEFPQRVRGEKFVGDAPCRDLPGGCLSAVFAEFERVRLGRLGPGAADAGEPVGLVLAQQCRRGAGDHPLAQQAPRDRFR